MRREGRQRGWVRVYDRELVDPECKRRAVYAVAEEGPTTTVVVANGGYIRASGKPTNHSKSAGGRAFGELSGKARASSSKGRRKFAHDEYKTYWLEMADAVDGKFDYLYDFAVDS
ncbi:uncharacterized protein LOC100832037 [Brachypodium distachyon]|uniref:Uncharacterized protein n=1 Tax=Brachypodium distachyon TaxID=15368 RepID=I1HR31_BRADI|nr:uncharacterized protein LOC100832037 [Brachypodium distachyon]KQK09530.1 hypothetical protein BRADI_2g48540v3 [Brachypodium distachyon]|eukprot:XP_003569711.1 uncharacterized protein LOC100832037 [Brachypodium distachyon]